VELSQASCELHAPVREVEIADTSRRDLIYEMDDEMDDRRWSFRETSTSIRVAIRAFDLRLLI